ncbi:thioredoxin domain-containing protein [Leucobacter ruminantium]|uniref:Thioredoxin domain-containing protein n=1 Tax=Leucobacter ruminantium TaxID=1289170 RepID=A0A939LZI6_9MICO|nr:thioredoxin domain-containing protein [Leucobacter ruminantium]MBO1804330.1 thioredoxin domain-containing protein [Leucobacter ruminantium]
MSDEQQMPATIPDPQQPRYASLVAHPPAAPYAPQPQPRPPLNGLAVFAFVSSFIIGLLGLVLSFIAVSQLGRDGKRGKGFAVAAMIIGGVNTIFQLVVGIFVVIALIAGGIAVSAVGEAARRGASGASPELELPHTWAPANMGTGGVVFTSPTEAVETPPIGEIEERGAYIPAPGSAPVHVTLYVDYACTDCLAFEEENGDMLEERLAAGDISLEIVPVAALDRATGHTEYSTRAANFMACQVDAQPETAYAVHRALLSAENVPEPGTAGPKDAELMVIAMRAGGADDTAARECVMYRAFESFVAEVTTDLTAGRGVLGLAPDERLQRDSEPQSTDEQLLSSLPLSLVNGKDWQQPEYEAVSLEAFIDRELAVIEGR